MAQKTSKKSKVNSYIVVVVLLIAAVMACMFMLSGNVGSSVVTETVLTGTAEEKISSEGYIIRDELVVKAPDTGIISFRSDEGERVAKGSIAAVIYSGDVSDEVKAELSGIHERIKELEGSSSEKNLYASDSLNGTAQVVNNINAITEAAYSRNVAVVSQYKDDITRIIRKNSGDSAEKAMTTYEQLQARKAELESSVSGKSTVIYAPRAGILCSDTDGYEDYFDISHIAEVTPSYLKDAKKTEKAVSDELLKDEPCFKIVNNYEWYYTANVDEKYADDLNECVKYNAQIYLRFTDVSDERIAAAVQSVSEPEDGKVAVVIKSGGIFSGMYSLRNVKAEIIRKTYKGFKVSKQAVHVDGEGNYYVFVNSEGIVRKRNINILYSDDVYAIIEEKNSAENNLLLYDEVIVSGNNIEEGKSL